MTCKEKRIYDEILTGGNIVAINETFIRLRDSKNNPVMNLTYNQLKKIKDTALRKTKQLFFVVDKKKIRAMHGNSYPKKLYKKTLQTKRIS